MKVLKVVGIVVVAVILIIVVLGLIAPKDYTAERTIVIDAPREVVFQHVQYWANWAAWSPWAEMDTAMVVTIEGEDGLKGALYKWVGTTTGAGEMEVTEVKMNESFDFHLHFTEPWDSHSDGYFRLKDVDGKTEVAWGMYGEMPMPWNIMLLFQSMDKMMEKDYNKGLANLKAVVENQMEAIRAFKIEKKTFGGATYAVLRKKVTFGEMANFMGESFGMIMGTMAQAGKQPSGPPVTIFYDWDFETSSADAAAGVPFRGKAPEGFEVVKIKRQPAYQGDYFGPYDKSSIAHWAFDAFMKENGLEMQIPMIEEYMNSPMTEPDPAKLHTKITYFAK